MKTDDSVTGPINLGNPTEFTIRELADQLLAKLGSDAGIITKPLPSDDPRQRQPDISKARQLLGWEPKVPLSEGLDRTIAYFQEELQEQPATSAGPA
jgi:UDP-glucuronate decarboxylase